MHIRLTEDDQSYHIHRGVYQYVGPHNLKRRSGPIRSTLVQSIKFSHFLTIDTHGVNTHDTWHNPVHVTEKEKVYRLLLWDIMRMENKINPGKIKKYSDVYDTSSLIKKSDRVTESMLVRDQGMLSGG